MPTKKRWKTEVYCAECGEWYDENDVHFLNIEEDFEGRDVLTFRCLVCGSEQSSLVRGR